jgi:photosystem II stability/assembly factor-like uncharacterized protein
MLKNLVLALFFILLSSTVVRGQDWKPLGPPGGDVRLLAADPAKPGQVFLGTADGHIFGSDDSGANWALLGRVSTRLDAVITAIVVDPQNSDVLFASAWTRDQAAGGGVFRSDDSGRTWRDAGLAGQAVRALAISASDPNVLVAGTLDGIYRLDDASKSWERISPAGDEELRNLDSLAIDPRNPLTIYAGTFHLPWKTTDGGRTWRAIHDGMIDDSDVMSLLIDSSRPGRLFASACSGIYRSDNGALQWRKIQGIPYTARRTYAITQDPRNPASVYAATSEGLWKTSDGGMTWRRTTPANWVVNSVLVDFAEPRRVLIGTEELGILSSDDGGEHFHDANAGFFHRQILALAMDSEHSGRILAVLAHSPDSIVATDDGGRSWLPLGPGLRAEQMLRVYASPEGWWASIEHGGLMRYDAEKKSWQRTGTLTGESVGLMLESVHASRSSARKLKAGPQPLQQIVNDMVFSSARWFAATENGLWASTDHGKTWSLQPIGPLTTLPVQSVRVSPDGQHLWVVSLRGLVFSTDGGTTWSWHDLPLTAGGAITLDVIGAEANTLISIAHNGLYISRDAGTTWQQAASGLPSTPVQDLAIAGNVLLASMRTGGLYVSSDTGRTWTRVPGTLADGFFPAVTTRTDAGMIFAASATDGLFAVDWNSLAAATPSVTSQPSN